MEKHFWQRFAKNASNLTVSVLENNNHALDLWQDTKNNSMMDFDVLDHIDNHKVDNKHDDNDDNVNNGNNDYNGDNDYNDDNGDSTLTTSMSCESFSLNFTVTASVTLITGRTSNTFEKAQSRKVNI